MVEKGPYMAKRLDWEGQRFRKIACPLVSKGMEKDFKRQAKQVAERLKKGHRSPQAHLHGRVRSLSEQEKAAYAAKMGWTIKIPATKPSDSARDKRDDTVVPWWSEEEWAAGKRGLEDKTVDVVGWSKRAGKEPKKMGRSK